MQEVCSGSAAMTSSKYDIMQRRASSMDDHKVLNNDGPAAGVDDGDMVVRSAHSSPCRGRRKFTWLRKVTKYTLWTIKNARI